MMETMTAEQYRHMRAQIASIASDLPRQQRAAVMFLRDVEGGWATQDAIGDAIGSSYRGVGNVLNRLLDKRLVTLRHGDTRQEWGLRHRVRPDAVT